MSTTIGTQIFKCATCNHYWIYINNEIYFITPKTDNEFPNAVIKSCGC